MNMRLRFPLEPPFFAVSLDVPRFIANIVSELNILACYLQVDA